MCGGKFMFGDKSTYFSSSWMAKKGQQEINFFVHSTRANNPLF